MLLTALSCKTAVEEAESCEEHALVDESPPLPLKVLTKEFVFHDTMPIGRGYDFDRNGKLTTAKRMKKVFVKDKVDLDFSTLLDEDLRYAAKICHKRLDNKKLKAENKAGNLTISKEQLQENLAIIQQLKDGNTPLNEVFDTYKIWGEDKKGNMHFTAYYTPILCAREKPDSVYRFPLYRKPKNWKGKLPSRREIDGEGVLKGKGLEIAYSNNLIDLYSLQIQGSGYLEYEDGRKEMLHYGGKNGHPYRSIGRYLVSSGRISARSASLSTIKNYVKENPDQMENVLFHNPSYTFFNPDSRKPSGAMRTELVGLHSVAVDRRYIPLGSLLLGKVPYIDRKNKVVRYEYRLLIAQDVGGAIKGAGHVDIYAGTGAKGKRYADRMHHYGNLWLLIPKNN